MANTTVTFAGLPIENKEIYKRTLLERLKGNLVYTNHAQKKPAPRRSGDTVSFRRFNNLVPSTTALTEGVTPTGSSVTITEIKATVKQYGDFVQVTDVIDMVAIDPVLDEVADMQGEQAAEVIDTVTRDIILGGTNVLFAGGKTARNLITAADKLTSLEIRKGVRAMKRSKVRPVEGGSYLLFIDADAEFDLQDDQNWKDVAKYQAAEKIYTGEIGKIFGCKVISNTNNKTFTGAGASSADVHCSVMIGANAYGVIDIDGKSSPEFIVKPLGSSGSEDPLDQRQTAGWKAMFTAIRLQELAILRIEHGATL